MKLVKRINKYLFLVIIITSQLFVSEMQAGQFKLDQLDSIVSLIYNFRFKEARELTYTIHTDDEYKVLPYAYSYYWEYLSGNEEEFNIKTCTNYLRYKPTPGNDDSLKRVYEVSVNLLKLRVNISKSNYIAPLLLFDDIRQFFNQYDPEPTDDFNMLYWGLFNYYITYARENAFAARYILNDWPESNKRSGIIMLENLKNSPSVFVRTEALYFLVRIYFEGEKNFDQALKNARELVAYYPNNYIYKWFCLRILKAKGDTNELNRSRQAFLDDLLQSDFYSEQQKSHFKRLLTSI
ncbi:hypothetical protein ACE01N_08165 [Saccharicrinis sp. FJH2]|uniref:hypothetical protein n=1 Tax=Saccharicrinis sp. FJH65 TaxID=3344659 RepID=UPI0035F26A13